MNHRLKTLRVLGLSALAGALVAGLVLTIDVAADSRDAVGAGHNHAAAIPWCDGLLDASQSQFHAEITQANARMHDAMEIVPSGDSDRDFAQMMIPHHQGAIDMALVLLKHGRDERLKRLAQSIIVEQGQEIAYMRTLHDAPPAEPSTTHPAAEDR